MKKKLLIILFILLFVIFICLYIKSSLIEVVFSNNIKVEINSEVYNTDYVKNVKNGTLLTKKALIDTSKLGKQKIVLEYTDKFNKRKNFSYDLIVIDTTAPSITSVSDLDTTKGKKIDLLDGVSAEDNSLEKIEVVVKGDYDFDKVGEYNLYYYVTDSSGNERKEEFKLTVKDIPAAPKISVNNKNVDSTFVTSKGFNGFVKDGITYIDGYLIANKTYSLPSDYNPGLIDTMKSQADKMFNDAKEDGLNLYIGSGFRSFSAQDSIYNRYVQNDGKVNADTYSARPGYSEHQSGLAMDVCMKGYSCITSGFDNTPPANWLRDNAYKYGFILRYPEGKSNETGYKYESWHYRYVGSELAAKLYNNGNWITMENYFGITSSYDD